MTDIMPIQEGNLSNYSKIEESKEDITILQKLYALAMRSKRL
eukprot:CAMPEP_0114579718 /NCGR_PEP_ID=MMETSP0125-20121206/4076_1 /TAXON_ID=485358 ORGANISM="Aristerostoma sp., Strain ATCC 50986" /NCGR_SAMPLE_ID=MMETSP0125 /ASSEMBLY_ACC=CAM_ASM_000245 /LENGTH=41 /DNA_ID= /DNA_START= /DNA_END= /DNA_ORIENTATION=